MRTTEGGRPYKDGGDGQGVFIAMTGMRDEESYE